MPGFRQTLIGIGPICDAGFTVHFSDVDVIVRDKDGRDVLSGWRALDTGKLWHFNLLPEGDEIPAEIMPRQSASLAAYSAYDLPSVGALVPISTQP